MGPGEYESIRLKNLEDNKRVLAAFGLMNPFKPAQCVVKKSNRSTPKATSTRKRPFPTEDIFPAGSLLCGTRRKSARLDGKAAGEGIDFGSTYEELDEAEKKISRVPVDRPNFYGPIPDVEVGMEWATRMECSKDGVHRPTVAGIHGGQDGAFSIALSGGYEDDVDLGDCFTYTGEGGRDLKGTKAKPKNLRTAPQSKDQTLTRGNLALSRSVETKNPVRVIRGYKLRSQFAPEDGYRYDGIYTVEKFWFTTGLSGYGVWKFALKRCPDQAPSPWQFVQDCSSPSKQEDLAPFKSAEQEISKTEILLPDNEQLLHQPRPDKQEDEQKSTGKAPSVPALMTSVSDSKLSIPQPKPDRPEDEQKSGIVELPEPEDVVSSVPDGNTESSAGAKSSSLSSVVPPFSSSDVKQKSEPTEQQLQSEVNNNQKLALSESPEETKFLSSSLLKASQESGESNSFSNDRQGSQAVSERSAVSGSNDNKADSKSED